MIRSPKGRAARELSVFVPIVAATSLLFTLILYPAVGISRAAPVPGRTLMALGLVWWFVGRRPGGWEMIGLKAFRPVSKMLLLTFAFFAFDLLVMQRITDFAVQLLQLDRPDRGVFDHIHGNTWAYIGWLLLAIGVGGFAEEVVMRGYLMTRLTEILGGTRVGLVGALVLQAVLFGAGHAYVGTAGFVSGTLTALMFGAFYLISGRNLWPVIIVHAVWDILGLTLIYSVGTPST